MFAKVEFLQDVNRFEFSNIWMHVSKNVENIICESFFATNFITLENYFF